MPMRIHNEYTYLPEQDQKELCEKRAIEIFLIENKIEFEQLPSLLKEFKNNKSDPIAKGLLAISDSLMEKYGTTNMPDFKLARKKMFINTGKAASKEESFPMLLKKGYRIVIAKPRIRLEGSEAILKSIEWKEYTEDGEKNFDTKELK